MSMLTINDILKEMNDIPVSRLEELHQLIYSLKPISKKTSKSKSKLLSFSGIFADMESNNYEDFVEHTKKVQF